MSPHWSPGNADLPASGVTPGTYGDATHSSQVTVNAAGLVTAAADVLITGGGGSSGVGYLASTTITSAFTTTSSTPVQATGWAVTVTLTGTLRAKVTAIFPSLQNLTSGDYAQATLWRGTVGSGTNLLQVAARLSDGSEQVPNSFVWVDNPGAGTYTYNIGLDNAGLGGTARIWSNATGQTGLLLVEAI